MVCWVCVVYVCAVCNVGYVRSKYDVLVMGAKCIVHSVYVLICGVYICIVTTVPV